MVYRSIVVVLIVWQCAIASAQTYRLRVIDHDGSIGRGTACCVGDTDDGGSLLVTARHNVESARFIDIQSDKVWRRCRLVSMHKKADVAVISTSVKLRYFASIRPAKRRQKVYIGGYGAEYHGKTRRTFEAEIESSDTAIGIDGDRPLTGDSGGFVADQEDNALVGIISGYDTEEYATTVMVPARDIVECLQMEWRCSPRGCRPVWIRPGVTQPMLGPIPIGPARPIGIVDPMPSIQIPPPPQSEPPVTPSGGPTGSRQDIDQAVADWMEANADRIRGRDGRDGRQGPAGPPGQPGASGQDGRSVSAEEIDAIVSAWLSENAERLRGADGRDGSPGPRGPQGSVGPVGPTGPAGQTARFDEDLVRAIVQSEIDRVRPDTDSGPPQSDPIPAPDSSEKKRLLYFTSRLGCPACAKTDEAARRLKDRGYPITIIDLDPRDTEIKGVPRVYHPSSGRDVLGPIAVADYLASVGY